MKGVSGLNSGNFCGGNESVRGRPIWELAKTNNEKLRVVRKRFVNPGKCERLGVC